MFVFIIDSVELVEFVVAPLVELVDEEFEVVSSLLLEQAAKNIKLKPKSK